MKRKTIILFSLVGALSMPVGLVVAANTSPSKDMSMSQDQEQIYGSQLMTNDERMEYQTKMRTAKTAEEGEQFRSEHHKAMQKRAKDRGITLPDDPQARGDGRGMGTGSYMGRPGGGTEADTGRGGTGPERGGTGQGSTGNR